MNALDYIAFGLNEFIKSFPHTRVSYEYDIYASTHYIEVTPSDVYHLDKKYIEWEKSFIKAFISQFPDQNICFISDDAPVGLDRASFTLTGKEFISEILFVSSQDCFVKDVTVNINKGLDVQNDDVVISSCDNSNCSSSNKDINPSPHSITNHDFEKSISKIYYNPDTSGDFAIEKNTRFSLAA